MKCLRHAVLFLAGVAVLLATACGTGPTAEKDGAVNDHNTTGTTTQEATNTDLAGCSDSDAGPALEADARSYARDADISVDEARRRLHLQHCFAPDLADLERVLRNKEADTFAGLWIQHHPEYRFVVLFTRDGEQIIRPYLESESEQLRRLIEVRSGADAAAAELDAAGDKARRLLDRHDISHASATNIKKNRFEIYVKDKARFVATLRGEDVRLPEHVVVVESGLCCLQPG